MSTSDRQPRHHIAGAEAVLRRGPGGAAGRCDDRAALGHGDYWPFRLRQIHRVALHQPDARDHRRSRGSRAACCWASRISTRAASRPRRCGGGSAWCSSSPTRSRCCGSSTTWRLGCAWRASDATPIAERVELSLRPPRCGTRSRTSSITPAWRFRAASSSGCVSRGRSHCSRKCCCWTSPARRSTRCRPTKLRNCWSNSSASTQSQS